MTYEIYRYIFYICLGLSGLSLIIAVLIFFAMRIPSVIGDLTGITAKKSIEKIRQQNVEGAEKVYKSSRVNLERGMLTDQITESGQVFHRWTANNSNLGSTTKINTQKLESEAQEAYTTYLNETASNETTILQQTVQSGETTLLNDNSNSSPFVVEYRLLFIHSEERIS